MLQSSMLVESQLKKKHVIIGYHKMRECVAVGIVNPIKVDIWHNIANFLKKSLTWKEMQYHAWAFFGRWDHGTEVDMAKVKLV